MSDQDDHWERAEASEMMADRLDDVTAERDEWERRALEAEARATQLSIELTEAEKERNAWQFKYEDQRRALDLYQEIKAANVAEMAKLRLDLALAEDRTIALVVTWLQGLTVALSEEANRMPTGVGEEDEAWESAIHTQCVYRDLSARLDRGEWKEKGE